MTPQQTATADKGEDLRRLCSALGHVTETGRAIPQLWPSTGARLLVLLTGMRETMHALRVAFHKALPVLSATESGSASAGLVSKAGDERTGAHPSAHFAAHDFGFRDPVKLDSDYSHSVVLDQFLDASILREHALSIGALAMSRRVLVSAGMS
ncbi:hypothetical protein BKA93DRAFT_750997 [Sparassis latifolia]